VIDQHYFMNRNHNLVNNLGHLDLNLLLALDVLLRTQHVTHAAKHVGVSQSAMSDSLHKLRAIHDEPLLVRSGVSVVHASRADAQLVPLRSALVSLSRLITTSGVRTASARRTYRMGTPDLFDAALLSKVLDGDTDIGSSELVRRLLLRDTFSRFVQQDHPALADVRRLSRGQPVVAVRPPLTLPGHSVSML
jgi:hypothetical protein